MFPLTSNRDFIIAIPFVAFSVLLQKRLILRKLSHSVFNLIVNCMSASVGIHEFRIMIVGIAKEKKNIDLSSHLKINL